MVIRAPWDEPEDTDGASLDSAAPGPDLAATPTKFAPAFAEIQNIVQRLKPTPGRVPDVDEIEPLVRRAQVLAECCQSRIDAVRALLERPEPA